MKIHKSQTKPARGEEQTLPIEESIGKNAERNQAQLGMTISPPLAKSLVQSRRTLGVHYGEAAGVPHMKEE